MVWASPDLLHWFVIPLAACGTAIGIDMIDWLRGRLRLFDARAIVGLLGYHFFFTAPLLMIHWGYRMKFLPEQPEDYRPWLGYMAIFNFIGLLLYRAVMTATSRNKNKFGTSWALRPKAFWASWSVLTLLAVIIEAWSMVHYGGVTGYINSYSSWLHGEEDNFQGVALLFALSESLPLMLIIGFAVWARNRTVRISWAVIAFVLFLMLDVLVCGLRGSRSNVIWTTFWAAAVMHAYVRRIPRAASFIAIAVLYGFVSIYAAYKQHGADLMHSVEMAGDYSAVNDGSEGPATVLVGDFSRSDVQANLLWRIQQQASGEPALGQTYLGAICMLVPRSLWPERPPAIVRWSTNAEYGPGVFGSSEIRSSRVYGIAGEAMLNFGALGIIGALGILGWLVGTVSRWENSLAFNDTRRLVAPFFTNMLLLILLNDSDNVVFYVVKFGLVPLVLVSLSSVKAPRRILLCKQL
jgi:hypothetical protein